MNPIKAIAKAILPQSLRNAVKYCFSEDYRDRLLWEKDRKVGQWAWELTQGTVVAGPFRGLTYVSTAKGSSIGPKLMGTYELELREVVESIIRRGYRTIVNIGAGEGYYPVGLANRMPSTRFICFDAEPSNQEQIKTLAKMNGVGAQIEVQGYCDAASLNKALNGLTDVLVICDIEGGEIEVLDPSAVPALNGVDMLVEEHDIVRKGCSAALKQRFSKSHAIDVIPCRPRSVADFPGGFDVEKKQKLDCMDEKRGSVPMTFFWMRSKVENKAGVVAA